MDIIEFREYCLSFKGAEETLPFDEDTLVFKVMGKMFVLTSISNFNRINVKCDPEKTIELRERYNAVKPGYHMSKVHWNSIYLDGSIPDHVLKSWIEDSYELIVSKLSRKLKVELNTL